MLPGSKNSLYDIFVRALQTTSYAIVLWKLDWVNTDTTTVGTRHSIAWNSNQAYTRGPRTIVMNGAEQRAN